MSSPTILPLVQTALVRYATSIVLTFGFIVTLFWHIFPIHILLMTTIQNGRCGYFDLYYILNSVYSVIFVGLVPPVLMTLFGYLAFRNVSKMHRRIKPADVSTANNSTTNVIQRKDRNLLKMLLSEVSVYILTMSFYPIVVLEVSVTNAMNIQKTLERIQIENFMSYLSLFFIYLNTSASFYIYYLASKSFRKDCKESVYGTTPGGFSSAPKGWNSFPMQSLGMKFNQENVIQQCDQLVNELGEYGYDLCSLDSGWSVGANGDEYGRIIYDSSIFDIPQLADHLHRKGLKLGVYVVPGYFANDANKFVFGTNYTLSQIGNGHNNGLARIDLNYSHPGAQIWCNTVVDQFAQWGVDMIKLDYVTPGSPDNGVNLDTRNRPAVQRTIDNEPIIQRQQQKQQQRQEQRQQRLQETLAQQQNTSPTSLELEEDQNMSTSTGFATRILEKGMKPLEQFTGAEDQDISVWIQDFEETIEAAGGDSTTKRKAIVLYLSGDAKKWYRLTNVEDGEWSTFREKLVTAFTSASQQLKTLTKLMNRKQGVNELAQSYFYDVLALCSKLNPQMNEAEKLLHLLRGVKPSLAQNIIMFSPKTIQEFLELAKRSETTYAGAPSLPTATTEESEFTAVIDDENSSEQVAAISRRKGQPPPSRESQSSNNHYQHRNFPRRSTFHDPMYPIQYQATSQNNYVSPRNNYNEQPEVIHSRSYPQSQQNWDDHRQYSGSSRNRCYNCDGFGHIARICPSARRQHQRLNE
ncbi:unnamed protein product [Adineta ricciae]|uniref:Alpha-galactosidase n=1 Tax=Adineta ricciae TaxID=249248 RepID=A0A815Y6S7_ADIRI|nr:unnamed protein product [Adineta ricciae]